MKIIWTGWTHERDGQFLPDEPALFREHRNKLKGKYVDLTMELHRNKRTSEQNKYYWAVVLKIFGDFLGYTVEEMHDAMKIMFLTVHHDGKPDTVRSTPDTNTVEFTEYIENIRQFASIEYGVHIPDPQKIEE